MDLSCPSNSPAIRLKNNLAQGTSASGVPELFKGDSSVSLCLSVFFYPPPLHLLSTPPSFFFSSLSFHSYFVLYSCSPRSYPSSSIPQLMPYLLPHIQLVPLLPLHRYSDDNNDDKGDKSDVYLPHCSCASSFFLRTRQAY